MGVASGSQDLLRSLLRYGADWPTVVGFVYRMVVDMVNGRDTLWLAPTLPALP